MQEPARLREGDERAMTTRSLLAAAWLALSSTGGLAQTAPANPTPDQIRAERQKLEADRRKLEAERADLLRREEQLRRDRAVLDSARKSGGQAPVKAAAKRTDLKKIGTGSE